METLVIRVDPPRRAWWKQTLQDLLPDLRVVLWGEDAYEFNDVRYAVVWAPPAGGLAQMPNLQCVVSVGAGVAHILTDHSYPRHVPIIRTVGESLRARMTEYIVLHVLRFHRKLPEIELAQRKRQWVQYVEPVAKDVSVGLLGIGNLGQSAARALASLGYSLRGWSREGRAVEGVKVFSGRDGLYRMASESDIIVSVLPQTAETENILDSRLFNAMPKGSYLINVGRGENLVEADLIAALDSLQIRGATLDVYREEPLPDASPLWSHPNVLTTMHTAAAIEPAIGGKIIADNIQAFRRGEHVPDVVDIEKGY